jgi:hypothetical protein
VEQLFKEGKIMRKVILMALCVPAIQVGMEQKVIRESLVEHTHKSKDIAEGIAAYQDFKEHKPEYTVSKEEIASIFPILFAYVPAHLHQAIANYVPHAYPDKNLVISELSKLGYNNFSLKLFKWKALGYHFGLMPYYNFDQGYFYFEQPKPTDENAILQGIREDRSVKALENLDEMIKKLHNSRDVKKDEYIKIAKNEWQEVAESIVQEYKIHLMPQGDLTPTIVTLLTLLKNDPELQKLIAAFKVMVSDNVAVNGVYYPRIVIYPTKGKGNTQRALNKLYQGLKNINGLGVRPLFNAKVTDLIWVAQGDSGYKKYTAYKPYFEQPKLIYFRKDLTGKDQDYHLLHPETGKEIVYIKKAE